MAKKKEREMPTVGSSFKKKYKGKTYELVVVDNSGIIGYQLEDTIFKSPTGAAKSITGHEINGWSFWKMD